MQAYSLGKSSCSHGSLSSSFAVLRSSGRHLIMRCTKLMNLLFRSPLILQIVFWKVNSSGISNRFCRVPIMCLSLRSIINSNYWTITYHLPRKTLMSACHCQVGLSAQDLGVQLSVRDVVHHHTPQPVEGQHLEKGLFPQENPITFSVSSRAENCGGKISTHHDS